MIYKVIWGADVESEEEEVSRSVDAEDDDIAAEAQALVARSRKKQADEITVVFPSTIPSSQMEKLFLSRILKYNAYKAYLHESLQIPERDMEATFTFEEDRDRAAAAQLRPAARLAAPKREREPADEEISEDEPEDSEVAKSKNVKGKARV